MVRLFLNFCISLVGFALVSCHTPSNIPAHAPTDMVMTGAGTTTSQGEPLALESFTVVARGTQRASDQRMVAHTASLRLSVRDAENTRNVLLQQVKNNNGFLVREAGNSITARIPTENMEVFLNYAKTLGNLEGLNRTGTDITDQYRDNVLRLDNLRNVRNRYLALLEQANTVSDILSIERELERVNLEIDRLEGRVRHAELSVALSNVTVTFRERTRPGPVGWIFYGLYRGIEWLFVWN
ncbi:MAG: DUF4349 domain-containing protein [Bacteroidales bacterium]|nr:DUF4349 domain-containing protein [Bacteroidales bacterium]